VLAERNASVNTRLAYGRDMADAAKLCRNVKFTLSDASEVICCYLRSVERNHLKHKSPRGFSLAGSFFCCLTFTKEQILDQTARRIQAD